ncbi:MAG TPA: flagellar biosynthesis anti-sigma factor FlgM [Tepidisphaeraceae bacterium]|nr:flagellar biosynthesis anti-sigma factor FlgM [Tepidisphaeraceae bacterium]
MSVNGVGGNNPVQKVITNPIHKNIPAAKPAEATSTRSADRLELSGLSQMLKTAKNNDVRLDKVAAIKAAIADGTYETDQKLDVATDKLLDDLLK